MSRISLSRKHAESLLRFIDRARLEHKVPEAIVERLAINSVKSALSPRPKKPERREREKAKRNKRAEKNSETDAIYAAVMKRAGGACECGCGIHFQDEGPWAPTLDHYFGRGKAHQTVENCWALSVRHHDFKTNERPSRLAWHQVFRAHCLRHGYANEAEKALRAMESEQLSRASAEAGKGGGM